MVADDDETARPHSRRGRRENAPPRRSPHAVELDRRDVTPTPYAAVHRQEKRHDPVAAAAAAGTGTPLLGGGGMQGAEAAVAAAAAWRWPSRWPPRARVWLIWDSPDLGEETRQEEIERKRKGRDCSAEWDPPVSGGSAWHRARVLNATGGNAESRSRS